MSPQDCISNPAPGEADAAGPGLHLEKPEARAGAGKARPLPRVCALHEFRMVSTFSNGLKEIQERVTFRGT